MDAESFTALALRVISREATIDEQRALDEELASTPARREELTRLRLTHDILRTVAPMSEAARAHEPELPAYRRNELRTAVRRHFGPAANRDKTVAPVGGLIAALRWLFAGTGFAIFGVAVVLVCFANRSVEVGVYETDLVRGDDAALSQKDLPDAHLVTFEQDTPFGEWQNRPLAWYEHAKIWVDNEHDLLHIVRREAPGQIIMEVRPLAPTAEGQRDQIRQAVETVQQ